MLGWELPPHHTGGLGVACYQMCKALSKQGVDIEFILPFDADFNIDFMKVVPTSNASSEEIFNLNGAYDSFLYKETIKSKDKSELENYQDYYAHCVSNMYKYGEYDIIHAHDWLTFKAGMELKRKHNKPLIAHVHATEYDRSGGKHGNPVVRDIEYNGLMMADKILAVSGATKKILVEKYDIPANKIEVVHNSIEIDPSVSIEPNNIYTYLSLLKSRGYKVVLSAGRLTIQKGLTHLLRSAKLVVEKEPSTMFLFVGSGDQYQELIALSAELGIAKNVLFTGYLNGTGKEWRDSFRIADLFVMPSVSEPFGITPLESIGYGTPALISKQSGVSELITNALKVDFWDEHEMANKIISVIKNPGLRQTLQDNSYDEWRELSWSSSAEKMTEIYKQHHIGAYS